MRLEKFIVTKLNGYQDVEIDIDGNKKILVAENGSGKTTILNILFYCLKNNTSKLKNFNFEKVELLFDDNSKTVFYKEDLEEKYNENFDDVWKNYSRLKPSEYFVLSEKLNRFLEFVGLIFEYSGYLDAERFVEFYVYTIFETRYNKTIKDRIYNYIFHQLEFIAAKMLIDIDGLIIGKNDLYKSYFFLKSGDYENFRKKNMFIGRKSGRVFADEIYDFLLRNLEYRISEIKNLKRSIYFNGKIDTIFLPTYRRIENDSSEILGDFKVKEDAHISFGIKDVVTLYSDIFKKLKDYSSDSFLKINSKIIDQYLNDNHEFDKGKLKKYSVENLNFILNRLGGGIEKKSKEKIIKIIENGEDNYYINLLVLNMVSIYEKQKKVEDEIVKYTNVCNKYLVGKEIKYCPEKLEINLFQKNKPLNFNVFSSGEKQIVSLFAKLYLSPLKELDWLSDNKSLDNLLCKKFWIIFDEPELSLSVEWQKTLLPDILESNRCEFLFVTTHSPFIFKNELKFCTSDIRNYIKEC
ncbi:AAA family ATPase [Acinetobacter pittii]|uniref:AAA family ATPase n=1 Tax=Acinetobacter pittii TaxID=48296 RepID=UPI00136F2624|nr:AAA family ATPase [Acinetobacter pittii]